MKKALIAVGAVVVAFAAGLAGVYFAMPVLSPQMVERAQVHLASLAVADNLARVDSLGLSAESTNRPPDSLAATLPDSLAATLPHSLAATLPDSLADAGGVQAVSNSADGAAPDGGSTPGEDGAAIQDSLALLHQRVEGLLREKGTLVEQVKALREQFETQQTQHAEAKELSAILAKLEDKELAGVVEQLNMAVLEILYKQASARNRARLLQAMRPQVAASFVNSLVQPPGRAAVTARPDTVSNTQAAGSEPESLNK
ncbi:MAG: hypothetical protein ACE10K_02465 [Rhodothermales bacterium]